MQRLALFIGSVVLAASQAQAELIINGQRVAPTDLTSSSNIPNYASQNNFQNCLANLRSQYIAKGVRRNPNDRYSQNLNLDYSMIRRTNYQTEFSTPIWDYLPGLVDEERVQLCRQKLQQLREVLNRVAATYGVPAETVVAVW